MWFGQRKIKKNLIDLTQAYKDTIADRVAYYETSKNSPEIEALAEQRFRLELLKIATYFDQVKETYNDFTIIKSTKDLWKLNKPKESEGIIFRCSVPNTATLPNADLSVSRNIYADTVEEIVAANPAPWFKAALIKKADSAYLNACKSTCAHYNITAPMTDSDYHRTEILLANTHINPIDVSLLNLPEDILQQVAEKRTVNLIITRYDNGLSTYS